MKKVFVAPSILSADFKNLEKEISSLKEEGASYLHFDVMDGHFVNNISFGPYVLKCIKNVTSLIIDVHLMISDPKKYYLEFIKNGANIITFHYETMKKEEILPLIELIHKEGAKVGLSIKPNTAQKEIEDFLPYLDLVLVMSVEPGFGGQEFMTNSLNKIEFFDKIRTENSYHFLIEVDGGINDITSRKCIEKGADILVSGSYIFKAESRMKAISLLKGE